MVWSCFSCWFSVSIYFYFDNFFNEIYCCRPSQELADFGNSYYNDHHYHWGYFIQTGALIAHLDPSYTPKMKTWVENLIRDANNPSTQDASFPQFRYFDWYSGHSWSQV
jgi:endoglucanase Acf2